MHAKPSWQRFLPWQLKQSHQENSNSNESSNGGPNQQIKIATSPLVTSEINLSKSNSSFRKINLPNSYFASSSLPSSNIPFSKHEIKTSKHDTSKNIKNETSDQNSIHYHPSPNLSLSLDQSNPNESVIQKLQQDNQNLIDQLTERQNELDSARIQIESSKSIIDRYEEIIREMKLKETAIEE